MSDFPSNAELSRGLDKAFAGEPEPSAEAAAPSGPIIDFSHISIAFDGRPVLEDVSFHVDRGQTLCIWAAAAWASRWACVC